MTYEPAARKGTFMLIGITGHSGSGKTYSSLRLARGLVGPEGKIAVLDTENGRASQCDSLTPFSAQELWPPFTPARYSEKVREASAEGFDCLIIDSASHEWEGEGGVVEMADNEKYQDGRFKQGLAKWLRPKSEHKKFMNAILQSRMHIIMCMRGKEKMMQVAGKNGRDEIVSAGVVPIQESRVIYEMTISLIMDEATKTPEVRKCPDELAGAFTKGQHITEETGAKIAAWISGGKPVDDDLSQLERTARDIASMGRDRMTQYWKGLSKEDKKRLQPIQADLRSAADAADAASTEPEQPAEDEGALDDEFTTTPDKGITDIGGETVDPRG